MVGIVRELISYPVKGCAGVSVADAMLTPAGLEHDRAFMVTGTDGSFRSQRRDPRLALIRPAVAGGRLVLRAPGMAELGVGIDLAARRREVTLFGDRYQGIDLGKDAAGWLSSFLGEPSRLVRVPPEHARVVDGWRAGTSGYADSSPVHALSLATLRDLNRRLETPLPMDRFRPNIVIDGWDEPYREDRVRTVSIGGAELAFAKLAIRCAVTMVDQDSGAKAGPEPLRTLAAYRRVQGGVAFGAKFSVVRPGKLSTGDELTVTTWHDPPTT
ncbi:MULTISPECIES: MOSC domain-containing protein [Actinomadura]|uniref:MOSC domain-containing protein n=1 Tax=Actinomadura yumaensis TaxID=111807 RepID=A0ABW2CW31_9ACTN|nr:MOSC N-terminal beta barrel domain-containing protein [Actinomadura sp. J1-007]